MQKQAQARCRAKLGSRRRCSPSRAKSLRFFADFAAKKWPLRGSLKSWAEFLLMTDGLSTLYQDLLSGSYDCVDRIVLTAYFRMGHEGGGFRVWWQGLTGSGGTLADAHLKSFAGRVTLP